MTGELTNSAQPPRYSEPCPRQPSVALVLVLVARWILLILMRFSISISNYLHGDLDVTQNDRHTSPSKDKS